MHYVLALFTGKNMELYIHIPFCIKKCRYCDFLSFSDCYDKTDKYIDALLCDIEKEGSRCLETLDTIYIGGGTPSSISPVYIEKIMNKVKECFRINAYAEISLEINPGTITKDKAEIYRKSGINRISMGVQSFDNEELRLLGRIYDEESIYEAIDILTDSGFDNISIDLIEAVPGQTVQKFAENIIKATKLPVTHISAYELIIEEGTEFYDCYGPESGYEPDEDAQADIYIDTVGRLAEKGFIQYEISNFAKKGYESKHNLGYWQGEKYIGCGLGASGYDGINRYRKEDNINKYIDNPSVIETVRLDGEELISEYIFLGLRTVKGIDINEFKKKFGFDFPAKHLKVLNNIPDEYLKKENGRYYFTTKGFLTCNVFLREFI